MQTMNKGHTNVIYLRKLMIQLRIHDTYNLNYNSKLFAIIMLVSFAEAFAIVT